ncbi:unnamed protein product [Lampetra planeri]
MSLPSTTTPPSSPPPTTTSPPARVSWHVALYSDVEKSGYLTKRRSGHRRYFVLRGADASARLECHDSRESWLGKGPPAKDARGPLARLARWPLVNLHGLRQRPRRVVPLCGLMHVVERSDERCPHGLALLTDSAYLALGAPDEAEQRAWLSALRALVAVDGTKLGGPWGGGALSVAPGGSGGPGTQQQRQQLLLLDAWQGELLSQDLGLATLPAGPCRVFFYAEHLHYVSPARGPRTDAARVIISLFCIKYFGHSDDCFFITLGNSSDLGPGQIWMRMQVEDDTMATAIHHNLLLAVEELSLCRMWSRPQPPRPKLCSSASTARRRLDSSELGGHALPQRAPQELPDGRADCPCVEVDLVAALCVGSRAGPSPCAPFSPCEAAAPSVPQSGYLTYDAASEGRPSSTAFFRKRFHNSEQGPSDKSPPPSRARVGSKASAERAGRAAKASSAYFSVNTVSMAEAAAEPVRVGHCSPTAPPPSFWRAGATAVRQYWSHRRTTVTPRGEPRGGSAATTTHEAGHPPSPPVARQGQYMLMRHADARRHQAAFCQRCAAGSFSDGRMSDAEGTAETTWGDVAVARRSARRPRPCDAYDTLPRRPTAALLPLPSIYMFMAPGVSRVRRGDRRPSLLSSSSAETELDAPGRRSSSSSSSSSSSIPSSSPASYGAASPSSAALAPRCRGSAETASRDRGASERGDGGGGRQGVRSLVPLDR